MSHHGGSYYGYPYAEQRADPLKKRADDDALKVLELRLAKGEISKQEYEELRGAIEKSRTVESGQESYSRQTIDECQNDHRPKRRGWFQRMFHH